MTAAGFWNRKVKRRIVNLAALVVLTGLVPMASALDPTIRYTFDANATPPDDLSKAKGIHNRGSAKGHDATVINGTNHAQFVAGPSGKMNAIHLDGVDGPDNSTGSGIITDATTAHPDVNIGAGPFTAMAWVNRDNIAGDNMVFGTGFGGPGDNPDSAGSGSLYLGFRDTVIWQGFSTRDNYATGILAGEWHHVAWRFDGASTTNIFVDGEVASTDLQAQSYGNDFTLWVGRTTFNYGAYAGTLADVRIYNDFLADSDIAAIAASPP
jgi:hypothetical protein